MYLLVRHTIHIYNTEHFRYLYILIKQLYFHSICYLRPYFYLLPMKLIAVTQIRAHQLGCSPSFPTTVLGVYEPQYSTLFVFFIYFR